MTTALARCSGNVPCDILRLHMRVIILSRERTLSLNTHTGISSIPGEVLLSRARIISSISFAEQGSNINVLSMGGPKYYLKLSFWGNLDESFSPMLQKY